MLSVTLLICFFIIYALVGHILFTMFLSTLSRSTIIKSDSYRPTVCFMIAAYNEEAFIAEKIKNTLEIDYPKDKLKIVVVSDGSTDLTDHIVKDFEGHEVELRRVEGRVGKTEARNIVVKERTEEIIVFSDATAIYQSDSVRKLVRNFYDKSVGMVSGKLEYFDNSNGSTGLATKLYWAYELYIKNCQSRLRTLTGAVGCINAFRRDLYVSLPPNIIEDFTFPLMVVSQGKRVVFEPEAVSFERTTQNSKQEYVMRLRVIRGGMLGFRYALPKLIHTRQWSAVLQLISHKVMRWLMPIFLLLLYTSSGLGLLTGEHALFFGSIFLSLNIILIAGLLGHYFPQVKSASFANYFLIINLASLNALVKSLTEKLEATWETNIY